MENSLTRIFAGFTNLTYRGNMALLLYQLQKHGFLKRKFIAIQKID